MWDSNFHVRGAPGLLRPTESHAARARRMSAPYRFAGRGFMQRIDWCPPARPQSPMSLLWSTYSCSRGMRTCWGYPARADACVALAKAARAAPIPSTCNGCAHTPHRRFLVCSPHVLPSPTPGAAHTARNAPPKPSATVTAPGHVDVEMPLSPQGGRPAGPRSRQPLLAEPLTSSGHGASSRPNSPGKRRARMHLQQLLGKGAGARCPVSGVRRRRLTRSHGVRVCSVHPSQPHRPVHITCGRKGWHG
jgi:hypothetical protein